MTPKLSYVIASKNDGHCGDPMERLRNTLQQLYNIHTQDGEEHYEVLIVDWGSDEPIAQTVSLGAHEYHIYVPPSTTTTFPLPFTETIALNVGIRRARGEWVARLDQDTLVGEAFVEWFENGAHFNFSQVRTALGEGGGVKWHPAFFSMRRDIPQELGLDFAPQSQNTNQIPLWRNKDLSDPWFFNNAVGILLAPRTAWHQTRGYDERLLYRNHMEHDLCIRFQKTCGLVNLSPLVNACFFHQWHSEPPPTQNNEWVHPGQLMDSVGESVNDENWGLGNLELEEVVP